MVLPFENQKRHRMYRRRGLEYAATDNFIMRLEYRYTDFGHEHFDDWVKSSGGVGGVVSAHSLVLRTHDIRFGIAYKF